MGGAINYDNDEAGTLTITGSTFTNDGVTGTGTPPLGGAVNFVGADGSITGSTFTGNSAGAGNGRGGALEVEGGPSTTFTISGDTFTNNAAGTGTDGVSSAGVGGAVDIGNAGTTNISDSTFVGNSTGTAHVSGGESYDATGGAIETFQGTISITTSRFQGNTSGGGTAIANSGGAVTATNDWWGADAFPNAAGTDTVALNPGPDVNPGGTNSIPTRLALAPAPASSKIGENTSTTLTASIVSATTSTTGTTPITGTALEGVAVTFAPGMLGSVNPAVVAIVNGTASTTYTAGSAAGTTSPSVTLDNGIKTTSITIVAAPMASTQAVNVPHDGSGTNIALTGSDPNSLPLTYAMASSPSHGTITSFNTTTGAVTYKPAPGYHGTDSFTFTVGDSYATSSPATVTLNVAAGIATATAQTVAVAHDTATTITLTSTDDDIPALTQSYSFNAPSHGSLKVSGFAGSSTVIYTPTAGYQGTDSFTFAAANVAGKGPLATVTLNVAIGTPTANAQAASTAQATAVAIALTGSDDDSPALPLTYAILAGQGPSHGSITGFNASTGALTYTPAAGYSGADRFQFTASNGTNTSGPATVSITVTPPARATVGGNVGVTWGPAGTATLQTDADGLRLLPAGRSTDLPWLGINTLAITLSQPETLLPSDVTVTGLTVASYPVTLSGSGTSYTITLLQPINAADRVTLTIGNANITTYARRLDVLPGDVNDDGVVTSADVGRALADVGLVFLFADIEGDGTVTTADVRKARGLNGTFLPPLT